MVMVARSFGYIVSKYFNICTTTLSFPALAMSTACPIPTYAFTASLGIMAYDIWMKIDRFI